MGRMSYTLVPFESVTGHFRQKVAGKKSTKPNRKAKEHTHLRYHMLSFRPPVFNYPYIQHIACYNTAKFAIGCSIIAEGMFDGIYYLP
jgi:hypothetical protein